MATARKRVVISAAVLAIAVPLLTQLEGLRTRSYQDIRGIWTVCVGDTQGAGPGVTFTKQQCMDKLQARLPDYYNPLAACIPALPTFPPGVQAALLSYTYNEGAGQACNSSVARAANAGDLRKACLSLMNFQRAGSDASALRNRRTAEMTLCLGGLK